VSTNHRATVAKVTAELNIHLEDPFPQNQSDKSITNPTFQDDSSPRHTARSVQSWFEEHEDALQHLPLPEQLPDLNTIKPLWSVLDGRVRSRIPLPSFLKELEDVPHEKWYSYCTGDCSGLI